MAYIPKKLYVGFRAVNDDTLTCFMTPLSDDAAFVKRKKTIDDWSSKEMQAVEITNEPRSGFRLVDTSRRWNSNNVVFRVIHPEVGAEFEISAENLSNIMSNTDIIKGEIQDKLLIIREGSKNILVIEGSDEHKGSSEVNDKGKEIFIPKSEYTIGDRIMVKGVGECVFFGKNKIHSMCVSNTDHYHNINFYSKEYSDEGYILFNDSTKKVSLISSLPKVLKKVESTNYKLQDLIGSDYSYKGIIYDVGDLKDKDQYTYTLIPVTELYGYCFIKNGSNYDAVYRSNLMHCNYGSVKLSEDGSITQLSGSLKSTPYVSGNGTTYYDFVKVIK